jgi:hypothetical protein
MQENGIISWKENQDLKTLAEMCKESMMEAVELHTWEE